ncbi:MAG: hypothetical protein ACYSTF_05810 [Planctomycetota bacterium]|jgi:nitrate reductase gamma subunit
MNWKQIIAMWCGIAAVAVIAHRDLQLYRYSALGKLIYLDIGYYRDFLVLVFLVALVTGGLIVTLADKKPKEQRKQSMNWKQIIAMWCGIAAVAVIAYQDLLFYYDFDGELMNLDVGYYKDFMVLVFLVALVTGGLIITLADKKDKK